MGHNGHHTPGGVLSVRLIWPLPIYSMVTSASLKKEHQLALDDIQGDLGFADTPRAAGYLTGDQSRQTRGNVDNEKAQWAYKQATSDSPFAIPVPSAEGVRGKVESVLGAVTGDVGKQKEGNVKAEKAAWRDGV